MEDDWYSIIVYKEGSRIISKKCSNKTEHIETLLELTFNPTNKEYKLHWFSYDTSPKFSPW